MGVAWYSWAAEAAGGGGAHSVGSSAPGKLSAPPSRRLNVLRSEWSWLWRRRLAGRRGSRRGTGRWRERRGAGCGCWAFMMISFCSSVQLMMNGIKVPSVWCLSCNGSLVGGMFNHLPLWHLLTFCQLHRHHQHWAFVPTNSMWPRQSWKIFIYIHEGLSDHMYLLFFTTICLSTSYC